MKSWRIIAVLLLCLVLTGCLACNPLGGDNEGETKQQLVEVRRGDLTISVSGSGNIQVANEAKLAFGTGGKVDRIYVEESDKVSEGDVLAKLDTDALELALTQAQVAQVQAEVALQTAEYNLEQAQEPYTEQDISNAEAAVDEAEYYLWYAQLNKDSARSAEEKRRWEYETYRAQLNLGIAQQNLDTILAGTDEDKIAILEKQVEAAEQSLELAQQSVELAQRELDEAAITAPFDGVVARVDASEGNIVPTAKAIVHLVDLTTMELKVEVDEIDIPGVKLGQRVIVEVDALPTLLLEGKVTFVSTLAREEAGLVLYEIKTGFDVPAGAGLRVSMSATADIITDERSNVLLVPDRAIKHDSQGNPVVEIMVGEQIQEKRVVIGISDGFETEIIDGLSEGDTVVTEIQAKTKSSGMGLF